MIGSNDMIDGLCPKCGSVEIYTDANIEERFTIDGMNLVMAKGGILSPALVGYDNFLCATCGYLEHYVSNPHDRQLLVENWAIVGPH